MREKHIHVFNVTPTHFVALVSILLVAVLAVILVPEPLHGGEGGYDKTIWYTAPMPDVPAMARSTEDHPRLAIIIDDFGQSREGVKEMLAIGRHLTMAVMPFCEFTKQDAEAAYDKGFEVIVHLPMEPMHGSPSWLGKNPILCSLDSEKIGSITHLALENVPYASGANVHMGSRASADERVMRSVMQQVAGKGFFFVDSRTGEKSVIKAVADEFSVPCLERNVFLDGQRPKSYIVKQLKKAQEIALRTGYAVAIGHVGVEGGKPTAEAIASMLDEFDRNGVELVFVSELLGREKGHESPQAVGVD